MQYFFYALDTYTCVPWKPCHSSRNKTLEWLRKGWFFFLSTNSVTIVCLVVWLNGSYWVNAFRPFLHPLLYAQLCSHETTATESTFHKKRVLFSNLYVYDFSHGMNLWAIIFHDLRKSACVCVCLWVRVGNCQWTYINCTYDQRLPLL